MLGPSIHCQVPQFCMVPGMSLETSISSFIMPKSVYFPYAKSMYFPMDFIAVGQYVGAKMVWDLWLGDTNGSELVLAW